MKLIVQKKCICFLFILTMIVSGMCFEVINADACFSYSKALNESSQSYSQKDNVVRQPAFIDEQIESNEICNTSVRNGSRRVRSIGGNAFEHPALSAEGCLHFYHQAVRYIVPKNMAGTVIVTYVHHQDGSKG